jgi:N-acetylneuraminate synthase/N,N'-diacetyllegionaminate synthase
MVNLARSWDTFQRLTQKDHCFIVAEIGSNHNGDLNLAKKLIDTAHKAGADAAKFQFFLADKIAADTKDKIAVMEDGRSLREFYKAHETPREWIPELSEYCKAKGIVFFATPFDTEAVDLLEAADVELYKIASFEIVHLPLIKKVAECGKPVIISTGMANNEEIGEAIDVMCYVRNSMYILLHSGISYPAIIEDVNLRAMTALQKKFNAPVGYSDHTLGIIIPIAAVARGAHVIEKHLTLDRGMEGADQKFALEPKEFKQMADGIRECERCLGGYEKRCTKSEEIHYNRGRRSIFAAKNIRIGQTLSETDFAILRPGIGLKPKYLKVLIGKKAKINLKNDEPVTWELVKEGGAIT